MMENNNLAFLKEIKVAIKISKTRTKIFLYEILLNNNNTNNTGY